MINVLLVDDHPSVIEGTKLLLEQAGDVKVSFAYTAEQAEELAGRSRFDVMLVDLQMPDGKGIDLSKRILGIRPDATILIYTGFDLKPHFNLMVESGICGFVPKTGTQEQLVTAVRCAARGESVLPFELLKQLRRHGAPLRKRLGEPDRAALTDRERRILDGIAEGSSNKEIARTLMISQRSFEYALTGLFQKLKVKSRIEAVIQAGRLGVASEERRNESVPCD